MGTKGIVRCLLFVTFRLACLRFDRAVARGRFTRIQQLPSKSNWLSCISKFPACLNPCFRVPEDRLSRAGSEVSSLSTPNLTTIRQNGLKIVSANRLCEISVAARHCVPLRRDSVIKDELNEFRSESSGPSSRHKQGPRTSRPQSSPVKPRNRSCEFRSRGAENGTGSILAG
jgi:hypothetical protein